jgi:replication-associated recombination protein RarA
MNIDKEKLEKKIGEAIGLEVAAQKAVEELSSRGLLPNERAVTNKLEGMRKQANNHQTKMEDLVSKLSKSDSLNSSKIQEMANETEQKATKIMETYLGEDPDSQEALEFLCLAEAGEVTHYQVLSAMTKNIKNKQFSAKIKSILAEEQRHLLLCTQLAKKGAIAS